MNNLRNEDTSWIIEMAWEGRTLFKAIELQFGLKENDVRQIMRSEMKSSSFKIWRKRVSGRKIKHLSPRSKEINTDPKKFHSWKHFPVSFSPFLKKYCTQLKKLKYEPSIRFSFCQIKIKCLYQSLG